MLVRAFLRLAHDGHCAGDKKRAQIAVTLLGESLLLDLAAARIVLRHETDPRGQVAAVLEQLRVGDTGPERTGDHRTNRGDRLEPRTQLARLVLLAQYTVERSDLGTDRLDMSYKDHQGCTCQHGQALVTLVTDDRRQLSQPEQASFRDDAELAHVPTHGVDHLRALADQLRTRAVQHRKTLLLEPLHRHERHARPRHRLADRRGINRVSLAALDIGLDVPRRHQLHGVPELGNLTCPVMRTAAGLHADQTRWQLGKERQYLFASQLAGDDDHALGIDAVDLEYLLCKIEPDGGNCCHGRPPLVIRHQRSLYGISMPRGAPSTSSYPATCLSRWKPGCKSPRWLGNRSDPCRGASKLTGRSKCANQEAAKYGPRVKRICGIIGRAEPLRSRRRPMSMLLLWNLSVSISPGS